MRNTTYQAKAMAITRKTRNELYPRIRSLRRGRVHGGKTSSTMPTSWSSSRGGAAPVSTYVCSPNRASTKRSCVSWGRAESSSDSSRSMVYVRPTTIPVHSTTFAAAAEILSLRKVQVGISPLRLRRRYAEQLKRNTLGLSSRLLD